MLGIYREALRLPGAAAFSAAGFFSRLPIAIIGLGIVLMVSLKTGSYAFAGLLSASFALMAAAGAVITSRWTDRVGQSRTLPLLVTSHSVALVLFVAAVMTDQPALLQVMAALIAGFLQPANGSFVRARWVAIAPSTPILRTAFAWESILDELIFTFGPLIASVLALYVGIATPLIVAAVIVFVGGWSLALQRRTEPPLHPRHSIDADEDAGKGKSAILQIGMPPLVLAAVGGGALFGAYDVAVVAFTEQRDQSGMAGVVLALWAFGSLIGGLFFGGRRWPYSLPRLLIMTSLAQVIVVFPAWLLNSIPTLLLASLIAGMAVAPTLISLFSLAERLVPPRQLTEGLTWANSALAIGFALGSSIGGALIDSIGTSASFLLAWAGTLLTFLVAVIARSTFHRGASGRAAPSPVTTPIEEPIPGATSTGFVDPSTR
jgi:predicted MFS family arabinose efflux permease